MLIIKRTSGWGDKLRNYKVMLDDKEVGQVADGETFKYGVIPGEHVLHLKIDYGRSKKLRFSANANQNVEFACSPNITGLKILILLLYITILCTRYIKLERTN